MPRKQVSQPIVIDSWCKHKPLVHITFCGRPAVSTGVVNLRILFGMCGFVLVEENSKVSSEKASFDANSSNNDNSSMYKLCKRINKGNHDCFVVEEGKSYWVAQIDEALTREWLTSEASEMENEQKQKPHKVESESATELAMSILTQARKPNERQDDKLTQSERTLHTNVHGVNNDKSTVKVVEQHHNYERLNHYFSEDSKHRSSKRENNNSSEMEYAKASKRKRHSRNSKEREHHPRHHRDRKEESKSRNLHEAETGNTNISTESVNHYSRETEVEQTVREEDLCSQIEQEVEHTSLAANINKDVTTSNRKLSEVDHVYQENNSQNANTNQEELQIQEEQHSREKPRKNSEHTNTIQHLYNNREQEHFEEREEEEEAEVNTRNKKKTLLNSENKYNVVVNVRKSPDNSLMRESNELHASFTPTLASALATDPFTSEETPVSSAHNVHNSLSDTPSNCIEPQVHNSSLNGQETITNSENNMVVSTIYGNAVTSKSYSTSKDCSKSSTVDNHQQESVTFHNSNDGSETYKAPNQEEFVEISLHHVTPLESPALMFTPVYNQLSAEFSLEPSSASSSEDELEEQHHHYSHYSGMHRKYLYDDEM